MNRKQIFTAAALALLGASAFAGGEFDPLTGFGPVGQSGVTRAQVQAEYTRARAAGGIVSYDQGIAFAQAPTTGRGLTRAEVKAEYARARDAGELVQYDTGATYARAPAGTSTLTREQVREETRLAVKDRNRVAAGS